MDKSLLLLLLVAVATSYAQKKCCFPNQFEGSVGTLTGTVMGGQGSVTNAVHQYAFDYTNKRLATIAYKENMGQQTKYQNIFDYNKEIEYEIQILPQISVCLVHHLPPGTNMTHCIPDSAAYLGSSYYGNHQLNVDIFQYYQPKGDFVGNVTITVSQEECVPVSLVQQGQNDNVPTLSINGYVNYISGISDPGKFFNVPSVCGQPHTDDKHKLSSDAFPKIFP